MPQADSRTVEHRPLVRWWADQMERVLLRNDYKTGWDKMQPWKIHRRLVEELEELTQVLAGAQDGNIIDELVDISTFAAFMAWNLEHRGRSDHAG